LKHIRVGREKGCLGGRGQESANNEIPSLISSSRFITRAEHRKRGGKKKKERRRKNDGKKSADAWEKEKTVVSRHPRRDLLTKNAWTPYLYLK